MHTNLELKPLPAYPDCFQVKSLPWVIISRKSEEGFQVTCFSRQVQNPNQPDWLKTLYPPLKTRRPHTVVLLDRQFFSSPEKALEAIQAKVTWRVEKQAGMAQRATG